MGTYWDRIGWDRPTAADQLANRRLSEAHFKQMAHQLPLSCCSCCRWQDIDTADRRPPTTDTRPVTTHKVAGCSCCSCCSCCWSCLLLCLIVGHNCDSAIYEYDFGSEGVGIGGGEAQVGLTLAPQLIARLTTEIDGSLAKVARLLATAPAKRRQMSVGQRNWISAGAAWTLATLWVIVWGRGGMQMSTCQKFKIAAKITGIDR